MRAILCLLALACQTRGSTPTAHVAAAREVGVIPNPPGASGRDVGLSFEWNGRSVWVFGDTFFAQPAADGYQWRASSWSWTADTDASGGLGNWQHALGADGKPLQLIPHTPDEQAFDDAHNGSPCPAGSDCGARHTAWPATPLPDPDRGAIVFYSREETEPTGSFSFRGTGSSIAIWPSAGAAAERAAVTNGFDSTTLFGADEPSWGAAAVIDAGLVYAYACDGGGLSSPCRLARAPLPQALDRSAWTFWNGAAWAPDWHQAVAIFDGAPVMSVHFSEYLHRWLAYYTVPLRSTLALRLAPRPEGPWSDAELFAEGARPGNGNWDYGLAAHHELARNGGQVEYVSYFQPGSFLDGVVHLVEVEYR